MQIEMPNTPDAEADQRDQAAYRALLGDSDRERALRQILRRAAGIGQADPIGHEAMARAAGARDVGLYIIERLQLHDPEGWLAFETAYLRERHNAALAHTRESERAKGAA